VTVAVLRTAIKETHCTYRSASSFIRYILAFGGFRRHAVASDMKQLYTKTMKISNFEILKSMATMGELTFNFRAKESIPAFTQPSRNSWVTLNDILILNV